MSAILVRLFSRFDIPTQATNRTLLLLNRMTLAIIGIASIHAVVMIFVMKRIDVALYGILAAVISVFLNVLARRGNVRLASFMFIGGIWFEHGAVRAYFNGGASA